MINQSKKESALLFSGDLMILLGSVWLTLFLRHFDIPNFSSLIEHLAPFSILTAIWIIVFFIAGLYEKHTLILRSRLPNTLFNTLVANAFISVAFFYFFSRFGIEPKTNLFIYVVVVMALISLWRLKLVNYFLNKDPAKALLIGIGEEVNEIIDEVNNNPLYALSIAFAIEPKSELSFVSEVVRHVEENNISVVVADFDDTNLEPILSFLYRTRFTRIRFIDLYKLYEDLFDRVPLSHLRYSWFLENVTLSSKPFYDAVKRLADFLVASMLGVLSLLFYPFIYIAIKLEDGGNIFIFQERVGEHNNVFKLIKFRTMSFDDSGKVTGVNKITKVGAVLRSSRLDELPQLWNVITGSLSLIGPRPELPNLVEGYEKEIPYYGARHLIKPGLSGWAQINDFDVPRRFLDVERTRRKLSYDLFYLKNHSLILDFKIALKTIKTLLLKTGT